jgi:rod shape-determining protein MreD
MTKEILILIFVLYFLTLFQTSFLIHFGILSRIPSLVLIFTIFLNLLEKKEEVAGIFVAIFGGFFWDIFSNRPIGFHILILLIFAIFIKFVLKKYIQPVIPLRNRLNKQPNSNFYGQISKK